jgi:hypothetical protein
VVIRHEGKIVREAIYYDMEEVRRQLGPREGCEELEILYSMRDNHEAR